MLSPPPRSKTRWPRRSSNGVAVVRQVHRDQVAPQGAGGAVLGPDHGLEGEHVARARAGGRQVHRGEDGGLLLDQEAAERALRERTRLQAGREGDERGQGGRCTMLGHLRLLPDG
jgi:hypothetical protein